MWVDTSGNPESASIDSFLNQYSGQSLPCGTCDVCRAGKDSKARAESDAGQSELQGEILDYARKLVAASPQGRWSLQDLLNHFAGPDGAIYGREEILSILSTLLDRELLSSPEP